MFMICIINPGIIIYMGNLPLGWTEQSKRTTRKSGGQSHFENVVVRWTTRLSALLTSPVCIINPGIIIYMGNLPLGDASKVLRLPGLWAIVPCKAPRRYKNIKKHVLVKIASSFGTCLAIYPSIIFVSSNLNTRPIHCTFTVNASLR